ncbi:NADH-quinone oxidoreductase subunit N [Bremerella alba]|uniref:NADH-quinone oxidoreductase subunit N n=1 Tax=Bremerella alba TaxID=980252 RepID=A0A7V8V8Z8_9BACT|nr:NADH-quinone oxidoreductase subunit N [Bremerella alba]MBA2117105.1 NAD(P)H-quinone oxidoreductase subunit 2, chloroplastic [Bremerella alba]
MFFTLVNHLTSDTFASLIGFGVELVLCATILVILLARIFAFSERIDSTWFALVGTLVALGVLSPLAPWDISQSPARMVAIGDLPRVEIFTGMLVHDGFSVVIKTFLLVFLLLFFVLVKLTQAHRKPDSPDFVTLVLGSTLGMCLMASTNHVLMIFLAIEMASVPSYVMVAIHRHDRKGSEAALKYAVYGAGTAGVMLYGISLLSGILNSAHLPTMALRLAEMAASGISPAESVIMVMATLMILVGVAFKLSAVPFHQWCPDVFEGATAEVGAFLSVASKAAALALLLRVAVGLTCLESAPLLLVDWENSSANAIAVESEAVGSALGSVRNFVAWLIAAIAAITCTFGNLAAFAQTNIKRLLAYSTIAHAGYMMMAVPAVLALISIDPIAAGQCVGYLGLYIAVYLLMNLGAFAVVAMVRDVTRSEEIRDYAGMIHRSKSFTICLTILLISLVGLPPLAGFIGKFAVFAGLARGYLASGETYLVALLVIGCLNTAISLFYYLRIVKTMTIDPVDADTTPMRNSPSILQTGYLWCLTIPVLVLIVGWDFLNVWIQQAVRGLVS